LNNVSSIHKVFSNGTAQDEASLIRMDKERNEPPEPQGQTFRVDLETAVLKRDGAKVVRLICPHFFGKKNNMRLVNGSQIRIKGVEVVKSSKQVALDKVPVALVESRAKPVRPRARVVIHG
jgi:hypothetical protein